MRLEGQVKLVKPRLRQRPRVNLPQRIRRIVENINRERRKRLERDHVVVFARLKNLQREIDLVGNACHQLTEERAFQPRWPGDVEIPAVANGVIQRASGRDGFRNLMINHPPINIPLTDHPVQRTEGILEILSEGRLAHTENTNRPKAERYQVLRRREWHQDGAVARSSSARNVAADHRLSTFTPRSDN